MKKDITIYEYANRVGYTLTLEVEEFGLNRALMVTLTKGDKHFNKLVNVDISSINPDYDLFDVVNSVIKEFEMDDKYQKYKDWAKERGYDVEIEPREIKGVLWKRIKVIKADEWVATSIKDSVIDDSEFDAIQATLENLIDCL